MNTEVVVTLMIAGVREEFCGRGSIGMRFEEFDVKRMGKIASEAAGLREKIFTARRYEHVWKFRKL